MLIKNPETGKETYIYSAIIKFTKEKNEQISKNMARVVIRSSKKGGKRKRDFQIPDNPDDPGYINIGNLEWRKCRGEGIVAVYHRTGDSENYDYTPFSRGGVPVPTGLCQKLEHIVLKAYFENSDKKKHRK